MVNHAMTISKSGIKAQQRALDIISNNIANVSTQGFKARQTNFQALIRNDVTEDSALLTNDFNLSAGVRSHQGEMDSGQGTIYGGGQKIDLSLKGEGFFGLQNGDGEIVLTRDGSFGIDHLGQLVHSNGEFLLVNGQAPFVVENPDTLSIDSNGNIQTLVNGERMDLGQIDLYTTPNNGTLEALGNNFFRAPATGLTLLENTNQIEVNHLEQSNVDLAKEFTNMIMAQRAYDLNIRVTQASDELKMMTNQFS